MKDKAALVGELTNLIKQAREEAELNFGTLRGDVLADVESILDAHTRKVEE